MTDTKPQLLLRREEPPPDGRVLVPGLGVRRWKESRAFVRAAAGAWCAVAEIPLSDRNRRYLAGTGCGSFPRSSGFETAVRRVGDVVRLYARWAGEGSDASSGGPGGERVADGGAAAEVGGQVHGGG